MAIKIGDETFEPRRDTYSTLLAREDLDESESAGIDRANAIGAEMMQARDRLHALGEQEGEFPQVAAAALMERLKEIRKRARAAGDDLLRVQMESLAKRLDPEPTVQFLLDNLTPDEFFEIREELNARPTKRTSERGADE